MQQHDFTPLYDQYQSIIKVMPQTFTSHQFIQKLAQKNQAAYVEALYDYRNRRHRGENVPFLIVHGILAKHLFEFPKMIQLDRRQVSSRDIFGSDNTCAQWRKIS